MKRVIREGIFETNSSSSHAVSVKRKEEQEAWRSEEEISYSEKEIRSPYEKMLFAWGIICADHASFLLFAQDKKGMEELVKEKTEEHEALKQVLLEECAKLCAFNREEALALMNEGTENGYDHHLCCHYFNEDVLDECTCGLTLSSLRHDLDVPVFMCSEDLHNFAKALFSPDVYFVTEEGFFGGYWDIERKIF